eukprot:9489381-Pyramimonas_sp.AAC.2
MPIRRGTLSRTAGRRHRRGTSLPRQSSWSLSWVTAQGGGSGSGGVAGRSSPPFSTPGPWLGSPG